MTATLGWIDFSKEQKNRVGAVLDLLKFEGMVDELGVGTVRDLLADRMFPGISTIQTRAKYFFYIPYILRDYQLLPPSQKRKISASKFLEQSEFQLMWDLSKKYKEIPDNGVIGISIKQGEPIVRRPSAIYWNGIYSFGLMDTKGLGAESFLKSVSSSSPTELLGSQEEGDEGSKDDADVDYENIFRIKFPHNKNWRTNLNINLDDDEADILKSKIISKAEGTLLASLLEDDGIWKIFQAAKSFHEFAKACTHYRLPSSILNDIYLAHDFSELMYGSNIFYNILLQKKKFGTEHFRAEWEEWKGRLFEEMILGESFSPDEIFKLGRVSRESTMNFIKEFWKMAQKGFKDEIGLEKLISGQELGVKGGKARLIPNRSHDIQQEKKLGLGRFDYRFRQAKVIINDIRNPR